VLLHAPPAPRLRLDGLQRLRQVASTRWSSKLGVQTERHARIVNSHLQNSGPVDLANGDWRPSGCGEHGRGVGA
jgi:hypothetical protein